MAEEKRGFFKRLFGRGQESQAEVTPEPKAEIKPQPKAELQPDPAAPEPFAAPTLQDVVLEGEPPAVMAEQPSVAEPMAELAHPPAPVQVEAALEGPVEAPPPPPVVALPVPKTPKAPAAVPATTKKSWFQRLKEGLARTTGAVGGGIVQLFSQRKIDSGTLDDLEDILIQADLGVDLAGRITNTLRSARYAKGISPEEVKDILAAEVERVLEPVAWPLVTDIGVKPFVLLMVGVNGSGKTTTIGKIAAKFRAEGKSVMLAAGDTFRAAAIEQLTVWGERTGAPVISREQGADAAGLAFDAVKQAKEAGTDVLIIDTAGRLQNKTELMAELEKVIRVIKKVDADAPHATLLVLDATVGQNALSQVEIFGKTAGVTGLVMTKLDGTARGGILVAIADKYIYPVHFIGVGESVEDLEPFTAKDFARVITGMDEKG
jgi:fused signal recognition particle receptor